jgi:hypothetical protein
MARRLLFDGGLVELGLVPLEGQAGGTDALAANGITTGLPTLGTPTAQDTDDPVITFLPNMTVGTQATIIGLRFGV